MSEGGEESTVVLSLTVKDGPAALEFYERAFGAVELFRMPSPDGCLAHAEFLIGNTRILMSEAAPEYFAAVMPEGMSSSCSFSIRVENCDAAFEKAVAAGAEVLTEPVDQFYGMREAQVKDPEGYRWHLGQKTEDLTPEEVVRRAQELFG
ncbi:MAG: VOC family protein [Verrucomicrobiota bacterium]